MSILTKASDQYPERFAALPTFDALKLEHEAEVCDRNSVVYSGINFSSSFFSINRSIWHTI